MEVIEKLSSDQSQNTKPQELSASIYKQELSRGISSFMSFSIAFTNIACIPSISLLIDFGMITGGPVIMFLGWILVTIFTMFVASSMAEICSTYPVTGSVYYWSGVLANQEWSPLASFLCGWFSLMGNLANNAGQSFVTPHLSSLEFAFTKFNNQTGFDNVYYVGMIGLLMPMYAYSGYEGGATLAEETLNASVNAPKGIINSCIISTVTGLIFIMSILYGCGENINQIINGTSDHALVNFFNIVFRGNKTWVILFTLVLMLNVLFAGFSSLIITSRLDFKFHMQYPYFQEQLIQDTILRDPTMTQQGITLDNFNYSPVIVGFMILFALVNWNLPNPYGAKHFFRGPKIIHDKERLNYSQESNKLLNRKKKDEDIDIDIV
ncbi:bidirectional amino acid transporter 1 [Stylonychia lemnae]|uniref:Bidirectional amino acid transporter 1 n=1 Tax=Stylonychia lemnae TaxID=5949 RepID=A0A078AWJ1_STYLE|nr:bidirectional amino acid transporter 1 [Stylonychia lemnae]|eukprot:CDW85173.1 bidirectional amino acid transporter 1 [Stylonychia lemnae]